MKVASIWVLAGLALSLASLGSQLACKRVGTSQTKLIDKSLVDQDLLSPGKFAFDAYEYATAPAVDPEISPFGKGTTDYPIDYRGRIFLPRTQDARPLLVFLHGNHDTCGKPGASNADPRIDGNSDFTTTGKCPAGMVEAPSYRGYDAQAEFLASHGYAVISINANRGITGVEGDPNDPFLVYARGIHVLKTLELFQKWSQQNQAPGITTAKVDLRKRIDWGEIGVMGHSRGGEGVRYAFNILSNYGDAQKWQQRLPGVRIKAIFEVAPIDFGAKVQEQMNKANSKGAAWNVLIPGCDADVSNYAGIGPFLRMSDETDGMPKSIFTVWGANHNFFNSEWQVSDAPHACNNQQKPLWDTSGKDLGSGYAKAGLKGSKIQSDYLRALMLAFYRAHVGKDRWAPGVHIFDPQYELPKQLAALAPSSREFIVLGTSSSVFKGSQAVPRQSGELLIKDFNTLIKDDWQKLVKDGHAFYDRDGKKSKFFYYEPSYLRPSWVLTPADPSKLAAVELPFNQAQNTAGFWTVDVTLAKYEYCAFQQGLSCTSQADDGLQVALVLADGSASKSVYLRDYLQFAKAFPPLFSFASQEPADGVTKVYFNILPPLMQTARFELTDFGALKGPIRGIKIVFPQGSKYSLLVNAMNLTKKAP